MPLTKEDLKAIKEITEKASAKVAEKIVVKHIEELAIMINNGFQGVQDQLDKHDRRLGGIEDTLKEHTEMFNGIDQRLDRMERWQNAQQNMLDSHDRRIESAERAFA